MAKGQLIILRKSWQERQIMRWIASVVGYILLVLQLISYICMQRLKQKMGVHKEEHAIGEGEGIVDFLMRNVYLQNKIDFYMGLDATQLEHLTTAPFRNTPLPHDHRLFAIALLKRNPFVLNLALANDRYNPELIFAFLNKHPHYDQLNALEDIFLPFAKKYPHKLLIVLALRPTLKHTLLGHLHTRQIFKMLYTAVFCCTEGQLIDVEALAEELMQRMVGSVFEFGPLAQKRHAEVDWGQVAGNLRDFLADLTLNLSSVEPQLVVKLLKVLDCTLLSQIMSTLGNLRNNEKTEDYSQALIQILYNLLKLLQSFKLSQHAPSLKSASIHSTIQQQLLRCARQIAQKLPLMLSWLVDGGRTTVNSSSGERVLTVGLVRYRLLQVLQKVLSVSDLCDLGVDYDQFDLMPMIEHFLEKYKWNNIVHILLVKIANFALAYDYLHFRKRHLEADNLSHGVLAGLLAAFRNRKYVFLHSLSMTNQGNRHAIYLITRIITAEVQDRGDLNQLFDKFKIWKHFMLSDMKDFQKNHQECSNCFDPLMSGHSGPLLSESGPTLETPVPGQSQGQGKSLQTIEQMLGHLRDEEKWSPMQNKSKGKEESEAIRKLDSLADNLN